MQTTSFKEYLQNDNQAIHEEIWRRIIRIRFPYCNSEDVVLIKPRDNTFDCLVSVPNRCKNFKLEFKIDYRTINSGNFVFELVTCISEKDFPTMFQNSVKISYGDSNYANMTDLIDKVNIGKIEGAKGSRHLLSKEKFYFCYAISKTEAVYTKSANDIYAYYVFDSIWLAKFVRENYKTHKFIITKSKRDSCVWFTVSMLVHCTELQHGGVLIFNSDGTRVR